LWRDIRWSESTRDLISRPKLADEDDDVVEEALPLRPPFELAIEDEEEEDAARRRWSSILSLRLRGIVKDCP
jgi:hypothetical protein